jgi:hypothetical protein
LQIRGWAWGPVYIYVCTGHDMKCASLCILIRGRKSHTHTHTHKVTLRQEKGWPKLASRQLRI